MNYEIKLEKYNKTIQPAITEAVRNIQDEDLGIHITICLDKDTGQVFDTGCLTARNRVILQENEYELADVKTWQENLDVEEEEDYFDIDDAQNKLKEEIETNNDIEDLLNSQKE